MPRLNRYATPPNHNLTEEGDLTPCGPPLGGKVVVRGMAAHQVLRSCYA
jgi:hypothetical protein